MGKERFSKISEIQKYLESALDGVVRAGIEIELKKELPYGTQLFLKGPEEQGLINVYYSRKKGISVVDCSKNLVSENCIKILENRGRGEEISWETGIKEHELKRWIGSDESGKGDFFGPLVTAAFYMRMDQKNEIEDLGVNDSKKLSSGRIHEISGALHSRFGWQINIIAPSVKRYNTLYMKFRNVNKLLGWTHAKAIKDLAQRVIEKEGAGVDGAVADQFGDRKYILEAIPGMGDINLLQRQKGESNIAVAAASILARACFENSIEGLKNRFDMNIPLGGGVQAKVAAREFMTRYGREGLAEAVKVHFKTYSELR